MPPCRKDTVVYDLIKIGRLAHRPTQRLPMSLQLRVVFDLPAETRRVAQAAFPHGTRCLQLAEAAVSFSSGLRLGLGQLS